LPGVSDRPEQLEAVIRAAREAGACSLWAGYLYLKPGTREHFLEVLEREWPEQREHYERLYGGRAYLGAAMNEPLKLQIAGLRREIGIADRSEERLVPPPEPAQMEMPLATPAASSMR